MNILKKLFGKRNSEEKATVRLTSLSKWIDLQYKSVLDPVLLQIKTNEESLQEHTHSLQNALKEFNNADFVEDKSHIQKLVMDYANRFSRDVSEFVKYLQSQEYDTGLIVSHTMYNGVDEKVHKLLETQKKYEHVLFKYYKNKFKHVVDNLEKIAQNVNQYSDIIDHESVRAYLQVKAQLSFFFDKKAQKKKLLEKKKRLIQQFDEQHILFDKYNKKANSILEDPKYKIEKEQNQKPAYYDLEFKDYDSKRVQIRKKCLSLKSEIDEIHSQIVSLELKKTINEIQRQILDKVSIEVEILED